MRSTLQPIPAPPSVNEWSSPPTSVRCPLRTKSRSPTEQRADACFPMKEQRDRCHPRRSLPTKYGAFPDRRLAIHNCAKLGVYARRAGGFRPLFGHSLKGGGRDRPAPERRRSCSVLRPVAEGDQPGDRAGGAAGHKAMLALEGVASGSGGVAGRRPACTARGAAEQRPESSCHAPAAR
jgi:hypothetical protein